MLHASNPLQENPHLLPRQEAQQKQNVRCMLAPHMARVKMGAAKPTSLVLDSNPSCVYHAKVFATTLPIG